MHKLALCYYTIKRDHTQLCITLTQLRNLMGYLHEFKHAKTIFQLQAEVHALEWQFTNVSIKGLLQHITIFIAILPTLRKSRNTLQMNASLQLKTKLTNKTAIALLPNFTYLEYHHQSCDTIDLQRNVTVRLLYMWPKLWLLVYKPICPIRDKTCLLADANTSRANYIY